MCQTVCWVTPHDGVPYLYIYMLDLKKKIEGPRCHGSFLAAHQKSWLPIFLYKFLIFEISTRKSNLQPNYDPPPNPEF